MRVLLIGERPGDVDYSDPALPPGVTTEKIQTGIDEAMKEMIQRGWQAEHCLITPDDAGVRDIEAKLSTQAFDCIVIGGGIRVPPKNLLLFEKVINAVHVGAPGAAIAFNTSPQDTPAAAARLLRSKA